MGRIGGFLAHAMGAGAGVLLTDGGEPGRRNRIRSSCGERRLAVVWARRTGRGSGRDPFFVRRASFGGRLGTKNRWGDYVGPNRSTRMSVAGMPELTRRPVAESAKPVEPQT
jgi:hypothetical protein